MRQIVRSLKGSLHMSIEGPRLLEPTSSFDLHHAARGQVGLSVCSILCAVLHVALTIIIDAWMGRLMLGWADDHH